MYSTSIYGLNDYTIIRLAILSNRMGAVSGCNKGPMKTKNDGLKGKFDVE